MADNEEIINPSEYTVKELVKKLYNDFHEFKSNYEQERKENEIGKRVSILEAEILIIKEGIAKEEGKKEAGKEGRNLTTWILGIVVAILTIYTILEKIL